MPCRQKEKKVSNLGKRAEKFSCLPSPQEDVAAAEATTEAHATMSDYDTAAADDEAGGDSDGTHSSEDEDDGRILLAPTELCAFESTMWWSR